MNDLRSYLRLATNSRHKALEQTSLMSLVSNQETLTKPVYSTYLQVQLAFFDRVEPMLKPLLSNSYHTRLCKAALARADLQILLNTDSAYPEISADLGLYQIRNPSQAMGALYVIEGSTLGMQLLGNNLRFKTWAVDCTRLVKVYGHERPKMWNNFLSHLNSIDSGNWPEVTAGAEMTFGFMHALAESVAERELG